MEKENEKYPDPLNPPQRMGYALVGLGNLTLGQLLPAFAACKYSRPVALVGGDRKKTGKIAGQYGTCASCSCKNTRASIFFRENKPNNE